MPRGLPPRDLCRFVAGRLLLLVAAICATAAPAAPVETPDFAALPFPALSRLVETVIAETAQEALAMRDAGGRGDCVELVGIGNAFALAYRYLGEARSALAGRSELPAGVLVARIGQARVHSFAGRVRTEQWLQRCGMVRIPDDKLADPRYAAPPPPVAIAEFTQAIIELREMGAFNLRLAREVLKTDDCRQLDGAEKSLALFTPYVDKLLSDVASRPAALGPRASRAGLQQLRRQLGETSSALNRRIEASCR